MQGKNLLLLLASVFPIMASASQFNTIIPMKEKGTETFFIAAESGGQAFDLLVDTGAGYTTLNKNIIRTLRQSGHAKSIGEIEGMLANGEICIFPVFTITELNLGGNCMLRNIDVAQTPENSRNLLGLSALRKASPFIFSLKPAELRLSNCGQQAVNSHFLDIP